MKAKQISVFLENKRGRLAEVTQRLAENRINIRALYLAETVDFGVLRLVVNDPDRARQVLSEANFTAAEAEVVAVELADRSGSLAQLIGPLAEAGINIEYLYAFVGKSGENAIIIFRFDDADRAIALLTKLGFRLLEAEEVYSL